MADTPTEREWLMAQERGRLARRAGRAITECPHFGHGRKGRLLAEAWEEAWRAEGDNPAVRVK